MFPQRGPFVAGAALTVGAFIEAGVLQLPARRLIQTRPTDGGRLAGLISRHAHLSSARLLVMAPTVITTIAVANAAHAPESLIVWPVLIQLAALFTSPTTDWESVTATTLRIDRHDRAPRRLTAWLAAGVTGLFAVTFATGLADAFLRRLLAVPDTAADLGMRWAWVLLPLPAIWIVRAYLRGIVMTLDATRWLTYASIGHAVVLAGALTLLVNTTLPGVACAAIALVAGVIAETAFFVCGTRATPSAGLRPSAPSCPPTSPRRSPAASRPT
jgi:hypothetical protein